MQFPTPKLLPYQATGPDIQSFCHLNLGVSSEEGKFSSDMTYDSRFPAPSPVPLPKTVEFAPVLTSCLCCIWTHLFHPREGTLFPDFNWNSPGL